jgi:hypothetical protein
VTGSLISSWFATSSGPLPTRTRDPESGQR